MGGSSYSSSDYVSRSKSLADKGYKSAFVHDEDIKTGKIEESVHPTLNPYGVKIRECRDSAAHPISIPIILANDFTGSMSDVPRILQKEEPKLMGLFLNDKASGKRYLGDGYPAIMVMGIDDYFAQMSYNGKPDGALQVGQFESGIEIDENLGNMWITMNGGGNSGESYDLGLYFAARHTVHDHYEKRGRKGYFFLFADEDIFKVVSKKAVQDVIGDSLQADIPIETIIKEVKKKYHLFYSYPKGHKSTIQDYDHIVKLFGDQCVREFDPTKVCEFIVSTVAMIEGQVTVDDLVADGAATSKDRTSLMKLSTFGVTHSAGGANLPDIPGKSSGVTRL